MSFLVIIGLICIPTSPLFFLLEMTILLLFSELDDRDSDYLLLSRRSSVLLEDDTLSVGDEFVMESDSNSSNS